MLKSNLVHQGAELAYLLRHGPEFRAVRREHALREVVSEFHEDHPDCTKASRQKLVGPPDPEKVVERSRK